ncbi:MAG: cyclase family protein [Chloroflexota bacterium]|nr:cyclase family protein [Chloroflexota bacterium]
MAVQLFDISAPIRNGMAVWEGDPEVQLERFAAIATGSLANVSRLTFGVHTATHVDTPIHFIEGAPAAEAIPLDALRGPAHVVDATALSEHLNEADLARLRLPRDGERLIFKTRNSALWELPHFSREYLGLTEGAASLLVRLGTRLVGIDYLSIAPYDDPAPTHRALLGAGVVVLEGLDLRHVEAGRYELLCLPLLLEGSDGAPARAVLTREEGSSAR